MDGFSLWSMTCVRLANWPYYGLVVDSLGTESGIVYVRIVT